MAKKQLTTEEKLQAALVPEEEQPYKVPDNWCWVYLLAGYAECLDKYRKPVNAKERSERIGDIPYYGATGQVGWIDDYLTDEQLVLLGEDGAPFLDLYKDKAYMIEGKAWVNNHAHILRSFFGRNGNELLVHYLNQFNFNGYVNGTTRLKLTQASMNVIPMVLPPRAEQSRLVARIESLFAKLNEAKEKIQEVLDGAELRKAAILHQAFTGKLTEKWRKENGVAEESRERCSVKSVCNSLKYGTAKKSVPDGKVVVLRMGNLQAGEIDWGSLVYSNDQEDIEKYKLTAGDVLFNRTNSAELVGKTSIYRGERPAIYAGYLIKLDYKRDKIIGEYLNYMLNSPAAKKYCNRVKTDGVNQSNINAQKIGAFEFVVPLISEQKEIVRLLDNMLTREKATQAACESALDTIDTLKKSILARAFRGELGTNDPSEASAKELLQEILAS